MSGSVSGMSMQEQISSKVISSVSPDVFDIVNESHMHAGPAQESHFKLVVVAQRFAGMTAVKRHQLLYGVLAEELKSGVHALALHLYTPEEWQTARSNVPLSPDCRGANRGN